MTNKNFENKMAFTLRQIDACYINSLVALVNACRANDVSIDTVQTYQNGFKVTFNGYEGDAVCHDGSYGNPISNRYFEKNKYHNDWSEIGEWETLGFPWDYDDVSTHTAEELAEMIAKLNRGENDWDEEGE